MMKRSLMVLWLCCFAFASLASAQAPPPGQPPASEDLLGHKRIFQGQDVTQVAAMLHLPPPPPAGYTPEQFLQLRVDASLQYFVSHGYLLDTQGIGVQLITGENGVNTLVITGPGVHIVIVLPCGPFLPRLTDQLLTATVVRWYV
jgi:hypothetical protein